MFTQPCFIRKNTSELRKQLKELGYLPPSKVWYDEDFAICTIYRDNTSGYFNAKIDDGFERIIAPSYSYIDCGTNEELFLALVALRDDTDKNQWFISNVDIFTECYNNEWKLYEDWCNIFTIEDLNSEILPIRKATVEEIIEHFK